ncbi:unnamed protein product, partial [Ectocarpus sp. 4 AP-2014]
FLSSLRQQTREFFAFILGHSLRLSFRYALLNIVWNLRAFAMLCSPTMLTTSYFLLVLFASTSWTTKRLTHDSPDTTSVKSRSNIEVSAVVFGGTVKGRHRGK